MLNKTEKEIMRYKILQYFEDGKTQCEIAKKLGVSQTAVSFTIRKFKDNGSIIRKKGSGRRRSLGNEESSIILNLVQKQNKLSAKQIANIVYQQKSILVSQWTISREMRRLNYKSYKPAFKPFLTQIHKKRRFDFATNWSCWPIHAFNKIIFSDECRFEINGNDGCQKIRRLPNTRYKPENIIGTKKFGGGGVMVWGCISYFGVGKLVVIEGNMDSNSYIRLLAENLYESAGTMGLSDFIFQQDNAPCHTSKTTRKFFESNNINLMEWPAQSPDLNPIEHVWSFMKRKLSKIPINNKNDLIEKIRDTWVNIPLDYIQKLILSMPKRVEEIIRAKGDISRY